MQATFNHFTPLTSSTTIPMASDMQAGTSTVREMVEAAEEFVEKMTDTDTPTDEQQEGGSTATMEERKAKLERLRKKMVRKLTA